MITKEFAEAATEINAIFDNLSNDILSKIPLNVRNFFKSIASDSYHFEYDVTKTLNEQDLKPKTKGIIALLYRDYISNEEEKKNFIKDYNIYLDKQEHIKKEKYNPENLFKVSKKQEEQNDVLLIKYEEQKWYKRIFNLFKRIFNK